MPDLTSKQRAALRGRAHALKPLVHVGKEGVTPAVGRLTEANLLSSLDSPSLLDWVN